MEMIGKIRRMYFRDKMSLHEITKRTSLSRNTERLYPGEARVKVAGQESKAMADQIMTADKRRLKGTFGQLSIEDMQSVEKAILTQLGMG